MKNTTTGMDGKRYNLIRPKAGKRRIHGPERLIMAFRSFGLGTKLNLGRRGKTLDQVIVPTPGGSVPFYAFEDDEDPCREEVVSVEQEGDKIIIEAIESPRKRRRRKSKKRYVNKILEQIDFYEGLADKYFERMFMNVFTERQLESMLKARRMEILLFDGLMYLHVGNKAYRL